ncbi:hypothetical protein Tco_1546036 [Tanacetum coccineum]
MGARGGWPRLEMAGGGCEWVKVGDGGEGVKYLTTTSTSMAIMSPRTLTNTTIVGCTALPNLPRHQFPAFMKVFSGSGYQQKDRKPSQNDKTEHGMEKTVKNQGQRPKKSKSKSIQKNQQSNRSRN